MNRWRRLVDRRRSAVAGAPGHACGPRHRDPLKVLPVVAVLALLAIAVPLTVTGLGRVGEVAMDSAPTRRRLAQTPRARADRVKIDDGLVLDLAYRDRHDDAAPGPGVRRRRQRQVGRPHVRDPLRRRRPEPASSSSASATTIPSRAAPRRRAARRRHRRTSCSSSSFGAAAPSGPGSRRSRRAERPRGGRVSRGRRGRGLGDRHGVGARLVGGGVGAGHLVATMFGDLLGVLVPWCGAVVLGCLVTAWLARHRHHDDHDGLVARATYRMIDKAAGRRPARGDAPGRGAGRGDPVSDGAAAGMARPPRRSDAPRPSVGNRSRGGPRSLQERSPATKSAGTFVPPGQAKQVRPGTAVGRRPPGQAKPASTAVHGDGAAGSGEAGRGLSGPQPQPEVVTVPGSHSCQSVICSVVYPNPTIDSSRGS